MRIQKERKKTTAMALKLDEINLLNVMATKFGVSQAEIVRRSIKYTLKKNRSKFIKYMENI